MYTYGNTAATSKSIAVVRIEANENKTCEHIALNLMSLRLLCLDMQYELHNGNLNYGDPSIRGGGEEERRRGGEEERRRGGEEERRRGGEEERRRGGEEKGGRGGEENRRRGEKERRGG